MKLCIATLAIPEARSFVLTLSLVTLIAGAAAQAAVLGIYTMGSEVGGALALTSNGIASSVDPDLALNTINLTGSAISTANAFTSQSIAGGQPSRILATQTAGTTQALAITNNSYFQFTLTPGVGKTVDLTSISMDTARGGASGRGFAVTSSADSHASVFSSLVGHPSAYNPVTGIATQENIYTNYAFDLGLLADVTSPITFRVYSWSGAAASPVYFDNITLNGSVLVLSQRQAYWEVSVC